MNWLRNLSIGTKLVVAFAVTIILLGIVGIISIIGTNNIHKNLEEALNVQLPALDYMIESDRDLQQLLVAERSMIFTDVRSDIFKKFVDDYEENLKQSRDRIKKLASLPLSPQEKKILENYRKARQEWEAISRQIVESRKDDTREGRRLAIDLTLNQADQAFEKMRSSLDQLQILNLKYVEKSRASAATTYSNTFFSVVLLSAISIFIVIIILVIINKTVIKPIKQMVERTQELAEGQADLTKRIMTNNRDEVGNLAQLFNKWIARIQEIIKNVKNSSSDMLGDIKEIASGSEELATRTNQQAASITETSTTVEEFASILKQTSENAGIANSRLTEFDNEVNNKRELIRNVTTTMSEIEKSSKQIGNIMNVINDISFQTNLLALNAAVEAARAGEAGRGFAVVASEVRNLAQKTAESAKTIQEIVTTNVSSTEKGMELVFETEEFFESIVKILGEFSDIIKTIENGSREQASGIEQINEAIAQLEQVINMNAGLVNNFADTGKKMNANAGQLQSQMEQFIIDTDTGTLGTVPKITASSKKVKKEDQKNKTETNTKKNKEDKKEIQDEDDFFDEEESNFEEF